jgi:hypothetical protein
VASGADLKDEKHGVRPIRARPHKTIKFTTKNLMIIGYKHKILIAKRYTNMLFNVLLKTRNFAIIYLSAKGFPALNWPSFNVGRD